MGVDYEQQLLDNEAEKKTAIESSNAAYDKTINDYQAEVDKQQQQLEGYQAEQTRLQNEQTDFAIEKINQQAEQAEKDYTKEQQAAYGDYKRQTDPYGANAEQMAELGLSQSGYGESSKVAMYTAYQNRVAAARASMEQAKLTFDNAIREAKLTNDINLAKIAAETLEKSLALSMESIVYLGNLELGKAASARSIEQTYYGRAQDIRDAQQAEIAKAQKESMGSGDYTILGGEVTAGATGNGEDNVHALDAFFATNGNGLSPEETNAMIVDMYQKGIITTQTVNGVTVWGIADEEKAKAYMAEHTGVTPQKGAPERTIGGDRTVDSSQYGPVPGANGYFALKDEVSKLQSELENAQLELNHYVAIAGEMDEENPAIKAKKEHVDKLREQLKTASEKLKRIEESPEYSNYKKTKEAWEAAERYLRVVKGNGESAAAISAAEEQAKEAKKAHENAEAALLQIDRSTKTVSATVLDNKNGKMTLR